MLIVFILLFNFIDVYTNKVRLNQNYNASFMLRKTLRVKYYFKDTNNNVSKI